MLFGVLPVNKPTGVTSRKAVNAVVRALGDRKIKVGHTGTLDPLAEGVLLVAIGRATRLVDESHLSTKRYVGSFLLSKTSDTLDVDGNVQDVPDAQPVVADELVAAAGKFLGTIAQTPPKYSAIHIQGKRAHDLARRGEEFEMPTRNVQIHRIEVLSASTREFTLDVECGTGTYIRTLGCDIAAACGSSAVMSSLCRQEVGGISLSECVPLDAVQRRIDVTSHLLSPLRLVPHLERVSASEETIAEIVHGRPYDLRSRESKVAVVDESEELVAIAERVSEEASESTNEPPRTAPYRSISVFRSNNDTPQETRINSPQSAES